MPLLNVKDNYVICPYDVSHQILVNRLQHHLVKCENAYKNKPGNQNNYVKCEFNSTHRVLAPSLKFHVMYLCPDRIKVDRHINVNEADLTPAVPYKEIVIDQPMSENWDDVDEPTYNPEVALLNKPVLINKQCVPPSERKAFRMQERQRHQELENRAANNQGPNKPKERRPQVSSRITSDDVETPVVAKMGSMSISDNVGSSDGFTVPKYARGRGRGRLTK